MAEQISQRELRNDSGRVMRALEAGESFTVTSNGRPVGELRPLRRPRFVDRVHVLEALAEAPAVDLHRLRADLDAAADPTAEPRG